MLKNSVVLVRFPFDDLSSAKVRPALCLTEPIGRYRHIVLAFITSRVPLVPLSTDLVISSTDAEFPATGLRVSSTVQLHRLLTANAAIVPRQLGILAPALQRRVNDRLLALFDLK